MLSFFERFGTYYNGHLNEARVRATYRASERLSFRFAEQWNRFRLGVVRDARGNVLPSGAGDFSVALGSFQTNYSFSRFLTLSALLQMNTANTQALSANVRLRKSYRPDSDLYVIYTAGRRFASAVATNPPQFYEDRLAMLHSSHCLVTVYAAANIGKAGVNERRQKRQPRNSPESLLCFSSSALRASIVEFAARGEVDSSPAMLLAPPKFGAPGVWVCLPLKNLIPITKR